MKRIIESQWISVFAFGYATRGLVEMLPWLNWIIIPFFLLYIPFRLLGRTQDDIRQPKLD